MSESTPRSWEIVFEVDHPTIDGVSEVLAAIARAGVSLVGHFTLPEEAWWDDSYTPMQRRIGDRRVRLADDHEALPVLDQLAQEPEVHRRCSQSYAYELFVARPTP